MNRSPALNSVTPIIRSRNLGSRSSLILLPSPMMSSTINPVILGFTMASTEVIVTMTSPIIILHWYFLKYE